jgi:hypothetical protein
MTGSNELSKDAGNISATNVKVNGDSLTRGEERVQDDQQRLCLHPACTLGSGASLRRHGLESDNLQCINRGSLLRAFKNKKTQIRKTRTLYTLRPLSKHKASSTESIKLLWCLLPMNAGLGISMNKY